METAVEVPYLTSQLPGSGGRVRAEPEDFVVEEVPAYLPSGEGEHLYLWVKKRGLSTPELVTLLSRTLGISEREVSYAGLKDKRAVTTQWLSVPARVEGKLAGFSHPEVWVLESKRHGNKLKNGHLRGNRFLLRLREVADPEAAQAAFDQLCQRGLPNAFGEQRFGRNADNAEWGRKLLLGERLPQRPTPFQRKLFLSALQSELFNRALAQRMEAGTLFKALEGDVLRKAESGGLFVCADPATDQPRVDAGEVVPAGPIFGPKMVAAQGKVAEAEAALLQEAGLSLELLARGKGETEGARRSYWVKLEEPRFSREGTDLVLGFSLLRGSYASCVLRELIKAPLAPLSGQNDAGFAG